MVGPGVPPSGRRTLSETTFLQLGGPSAGGLTDQVVALGDVRRAPGGLHVRRGGGGPVAVELVQVAADGVPPVPVAEHLAQPVGLEQLQQLTFSQRRPNAIAAPRPGFVELPKCLACVLLALSTASEGLVRLIELRAQLRDGSAQEFELGALLVAQFDAPIPSLIGLSHRPVFAVRRRAPARRDPACPRAQKQPCWRDH